MSIIRQLLEERVVGWTLPLSPVLADNALTILSFILVIFGQPFDKLATVPQSFALDEIKLISDIAHTVFQAIAPVATIRLSAELPDVIALTMALIFFKVPLVLPGAIEPLQRSFPMLLIPQPVALILDPIWPHINTIATDLILIEVAPVDTSIWAGKLSMAVLFTIEILAIVGGFVGENLVTFAVGTVVSPITLVKSAIWLNT